MRVESAVALSLSQCSTFCLTSVSPLPMAQPAALMLCLTCAAHSLPFGVHSLSFAGLKGSTALSQAVVTGGALAGFIYSSSKRHPDDHEHSLIDFDLALILTPMLLLGITAGKAWSNCCT